MISFDTVEVRTWNWSASLTPGKSVLYYVVYNTVYISPLKYRLFTALTVYIMSLDLPVLDEAICTKT